MNVMGKTYAELLQEYTDLCGKISQFENQLKTNPDFFKTELIQMGNDFDMRGFRMTAKQAIERNLTNEDDYEHVLNKVNGYDDRTWKFLAFQSYYNSTYPGIKLADNPNFPKLPLRFTYDFDTPGMVERAGAFRQKLQQCSESLLDLSKSKEIEERKYVLPKIKQKATNIYYRGDYNGPDSERISYDDAMHDLATGKPVTVYNGFSKKGTKYEPELDKDNKLTGFTPKQVERSIGEKSTKPTKDGIFYNLRALVDAQDSLSASDHWYNINSRDFHKCKSGLTDAIDTLTDYYKAPDPNKLSGMHDTLEKALSDINRHMTDIQSGTASSGLFANKAERLQGLMAARNAIENAMDLNRELYVKTGEQMKNRYEKLSQKTGDPEKDKANLVSMAKMLNYSSKLEGKGESKDSITHDIYTTRKGLYEKITERIGEAGAKDINELGTKLGLNKKQLKEVVSAFGKDGVNKVKDIVKEHAPKEPENIVPQDNNVQKKSKAKVAGT